MFVIYASLIFLYLSSKSSLLLIISFNCTVFPFNTIIGIQITEKKYYHNISLQLWFSTIVISPQPSNCLYSINYNVGWTFRSFLLFMLLILSLFVNFRISLKKFNLVGCLFSFCITHKLQPIHMSYNQV